MDGPQDRRNIGREDQSRFCERTRTSAGRTHAATDNRTFIGGPNSGENGGLDLVGNRHRSPVAPLLAWVFDLGESSERSETLASETLPSPDMDKPASRSRPFFWKAMLVDNRNITEGRLCSGSRHGMVFG